MTLLLKNYSLVEVMYLLISVIRLSSSGETQRILIEMGLINKVHTYTKHPEKDNTEKS